MRSKVKKLHGVCCRWVWLSAEQQTVLLNGSHWFLFLHALLSASSPLLELRFGKNHWKSFSPNIPLQIGPALAGLLTDRPGKFWETSTAENPQPAWTTSSRSGVSCYEVFSPTLIRTFLTATRDLQFLLIPILGNQYHFPLSLILLYVRGQWGVHNL